MSTYKVKRNDSKPLNAFSESEKTRLEMNMDLVPHARWGAGEHYLVKGFGNAVFSGMYRFDKVTHSISQGTYTVNADGVRVPMPATPPKKTADASTSNKRKKEIIHTVRTGENLWTILKKYGRSPYKYDELAHYNKIKDPDLIYPNQKVRIPPNI